MIDSLRNELARERESRKQAEDKAFNAAIEAAAKRACVLCDGGNRYIRVVPQPARDGLYHFFDDTDEIAATCRAASIRALSKPIPQEPAERERGK